MLRTHDLYLIQLKPLQGRQQPVEFLLPLELLSHINLLFHHHQDEFYFECHQVPAIIIALNARYGLAIGSGNLTSILLALSEET